MIERNKVHHGNCLEILNTLPDESVDCCVTSPPYWGLRDYGIPTVDWPDGWHGSLGLEPTPELFVAHLVEILSEVHRVLKKSGTLWLNFGDCYVTDSIGIRDGMATHSWKSDTGAIKKGGLTRAGKIDGLRLHRNRNERRLHCDRPKNTQAAVAVCLKGKN